MKIVEKLSAGETVVVADLLNNTLSDEQRTQQTATEVDTRAILVVVPSNLGTPMQQRIDRLRQEISRLRGMARTADSKAAADLRSLAHEMKNTVNDMERTAQEMESCLNKHAQRDGDQ